jgi:hypothetical protein
MQIPWAGVRSRSYPPRWLISRARLTDPPGSTSRRPGGPILDPGALYAGDVGGPVDAREDEEGKGADER